MGILLSLLIVGTPVPAAAPLPAATTRGQPIYLDSARNVSVEYFELPNGTSVFTSRMPAGWTFGVNVDGNQDGIWGSGTGMPKNSVETSLDRKFGQDSRNGVFCSQYVFTAAEGDPTQIYASSECGGLKSNGHVRMSGFDSANRATIAYEIPSDEVFGTAKTARIEVCVYDTARMSCQHSMPNLLTIKRSTATRAGKKSR